MAAPVRVAGTKTFQRDKWLFVPAIANIAAPKITEISAVGALDVSCFWHADTGKPTQTTNRVQRPRVLCDGGQYETIGTTTYQGATARYRVSPQAATGSNGKKAYEKFPEGTVGFMVRRLGVLVATDIAVGDFVDVYPCEYGPGMPTTSSDGEDGEVIILQDWAVTDAPAFLVAVVTGP